LLSAPGFFFTSHLGLAAKSTHIPTPTVKPHAQPQLFV
jgi:hypothetical protein